MLTGYNTDIKLEDVIYHVQTEDGGIENPVIVSLIYQGGRILASKKTSYAHLLGSQDVISQVRALLEQQHRAMIKAILTGAPVAEAGKAPAAPEAARSQAQAPASPSTAPPQQTPPQPVPQPPGDASPASATKPPLEIPPEAVAEGPEEGASEKNLDQVILEYLASEIDKD